MYQYVAKLIRVVDGDTVWLDVDLGFTVHVNICFRLAGINAPEMVGEASVAGKAAKAHLESLLNLGTLKIVSLKPLKTDKYGRWLAYITVKLGDGSEIDVNQRMVNDGHAVISLV